MAAESDLCVEDLAQELHLTDRYIRELARAAISRSGKVGLTLLEDPTTGKPIKGEDGLAFSVVSSPPSRRGRPSKKRGESTWAFRRVRLDSVTLAQRYLLPGSPQGRNQKSIKAIAAAAGITPGGPVRGLSDASPGEPTHVIAADDPGPVLGMLLLPEGMPVEWRPSKGDHVEVLVRGTLLVPTAGPIGMGPGFDRILWDLETQCWWGEPQEERRLLEMFGSWGLDHESDGRKPAAVLLSGVQGLRLDWVHGDPRD
ncbi:protein of unknown function [Cyanobium sp. NIES-981]|nr:protein of unknown function [Cyanobium sp. NIES-981]